MDDEPPPLICLALNVADTICRDPISGTYSLVGLLDTVYVDHFPAVLPTFGVYTAVTGGHGHVHLVVELASPRTANPADDRRIWDRGTDLYFDDPLQITEVIAKVESLEVPSRGTYRIKLHADSAFLSERRLAVTLKPSDGEANHGD